MNKIIENQTLEILNELGISKLPIPIKQIAKERGIQIKPYKFDDDVSGLLLLQNGNAIIGYDPLESSVRQRFTIAHEFGHFILHSKVSGLFVDKIFKVHFRDSESSTGENKKEKEANAFAAAILMPRNLLVNEINKSDYDLADDSFLKELAKKFNVSTQAMSFRISNLRLFS
jgi:Zn-dependent peptidase ImmA (M78 family)